jgi:predicted dehydrogenase
MGLRLGLLSTAKINGAILRGAEQTDAAEVVAVASRDGARAEAYAREHGIARAHGSYEALLADPDVDAVYISLPNSMHVEWAIRALEAGKHVLCEKPLTRHPEDAERAFDAAERAGRVLMEAFMWRHTPQAAKLRELVPRLGELRVIRTHFSFGGLAPGNVRLSSELEGGALMDVGCYCVSGARFVAGSEPEAFAGQQVLTGDGVDIAFTGLLRFAGDVLCHFDCGMASTDRAELEVVGSEGRLFLADPWHSRETVIVCNGERIEVESKDPYACELEALASGEPGFGRADAVAQARAIAALYEASSAGEARCGGERSETG